MIDKLKELISNGGWLPIEEAPKALTVLVRIPFDSENGGFYHVVAALWINKWFCQGKEIGDTQPTHFMPLVTPERMAKVIEVLVDALEDIRQRAFAVHNASAIFNGKNVVFASTRESAEAIKSIADSTAKYKCTIKEVNICVTEYRTATDYLPFIDYKKIALQKVNEIAGGE